MRFGVINEVKGFAELDRFLAEFPEKLQRKALANSLRPAGRVIRDLARHLVPVKSGRLRRSIRVTIVRRQGKVIARVIAGRQMKKDDPFYAWMVEGGTDPHRIRAKTRGGMLRLHGGRFVSEVEHPGARAVPFLGPALEDGADSALQVMRDALAAEIESMGNLGAAA
jgi:HK97 gp10 family phage protein